jgi:hypothetical protein
MRFNFIFLFLLPISLLLSESTPSPYKISADFLYFGLYSDFHENKNNPFAPGFKVGIGKILEHDSWEIYGEYTRISFNDHKRIKKHTYNIANLTIGKSIDASKKVSFDLYTGLKGAFIYSKYQIGQFGTLSSDINAVGVIFGANSHWHLKRNYELFSLFSASGLNAWSASHLNNKAYRSNLKCSSLKTNLNLSLGVKKEFLLKNEKLISIYAAWEMQIWLYLNPFTCGCSTNSNSTLSYQGLTLNLEYKF